MTPKTRELALRGLGLLRGENYERARRAFSGCSPDQMQEVWSGNGETRQQVLDGYREYAEAVDAAVKEIGAL